MNSGDFIGKSSNDINKAKNFLNNQHKDNDERLKEGYKNKVKIRMNVNDFISSTSTHAVDNRAGSKSLYGLNTEITMPGIKTNTDSNGMLFFTRPNLNLSESNLLNDKKTLRFLSNNATDLNTYIRCMLAPSLTDAAIGPSGLKSNLCNNKLAYIPIMSNNLLTFSGWPDEVVPTKSSEEGLRGEQYTQVDGVMEINNALDFDATFRNFHASPLYQMLFLWTRYSTNVFEGTMKPLDTTLVANEIDYQTRIYRLILDEHNKVVTDIAAVPACFPVNNPKGKKFDYDRFRPRSGEDNIVNFRFKSAGVIYDDEYLVVEFNITTCTFNSDLWPVVDGNFKEGNGHSYIRVPENLKQYLNFCAYPLINTNNMNLEWWVDKHSIDYKEATRIDRHMRRLKGELK